MTHAARSEICNRQSSGTQQRCAISSAIALADCTWLLDIGDRRMRIGDVQKAASDFLCKALLTLVVAGVSRLSARQPSSTVSSETFFTRSKSWITFKISSMRFAGSPESGSSARYLASTSLHSMPRGPDPLGASTVLVYLAPDLVTIVTVAPQLQS